LFENQDFDNFREEFLENLKRWVSLYLFPAFFLFCFPLYFGTSLANE